MYLTNFEKFVSDTILERGRKYYRQGKVVELFEEDGVFSALVDGTECYDVTIEVDSNGKIVEHNCTCPYDMGNICKHKVAMLFTIRDGEPQTTNAQVGKKSIMSAQLGKKSAAGVKVKEPKSPPLKDIVEKLSREELAAIVLNQAKSNKIFEAEIIRTHSPRTGDLAAAKKLIMSSIRQNKRQGFIEYGQLDDALIGADIVIYDAQQLHDSGEYIKALDLFLLTNAIVTDVSSYSDDDGDISIRLDECREGVSAIVFDIVENSDKKLWKSCFDRLINESKNPVYCGCNYGLDLLEECIPFCIDKVFLDELWHVLDESLKNLKGDTYNYRKDTVDRIKHRILILTDDVAAEKFEEVNIKIFYFRELLIKRNIARQDYEKAINLCGELGFSCRCDYLLSIYRKIGQTDNYRKTLLEAVYTVSIEPYFYDLKATYDDDEWRTLLPSILDGIENTNRNANRKYREILIEYRFFDRLLICVKNQPSLIVDYYKQLLTDYDEEVKSIFEHYLTHKFAIANTRSQYIDCCRQMRIYKKACGGELMRDLRDKMLTLYPRKPALIEELNNLN